MKKSGFTAHRIEIKIEGFQIYKLISLCLEKKIELRNIRCVSDIETRCTIQKGDYGKLKKAAKSNYRITIIEEKGYIPLIKNIGARKATLAGLAIFFIIIYYQSLFVSEIRIYGYEHFSEAQIREALYQVDFREGARKLTTKEEINDVKLHLFNALKEISWVGITYSGTLAEVTIVEGVSGEKQVSEKKPCNIVADRSGYIEEIIPIEGMRAVADGTFVMPGDVLISGIMPVSSTAYGSISEEITERYVHAAGTVKAYIPHFISFTITPGVVASTHNEQVVGEEIKEGEKDYDFVKRVSDRLIRKYIAENIPEKALITNKHLNFTVKENIIDVKVLIETLQEIGMEQEIEIEQEIGNGSTEPV